MAWLRPLVCVAVAAHGTACGTPAMQDPRAAAVDFTRAAARGDGRSVHARLTADARRTLGERGTLRVVADSRAEMEALARATASKGTTVRAVAEIPFPDGEHAVLVLEGGHFRVSAGAGLPSAPRTPPAALAELASALRRRSYAGLIRILSSETAGALEEDLRALIAGLEHPSRLPIHVRGDAADVELPGGHRVVLKREAGVWRIHDFD